MLEGFQLEGVVAAPLALTAGMSAQVADAHISFSISPLPTGERLLLYMSPTTTVDWSSLLLSVSVAAIPFSALFCNGYQSWSESREYTPAEHIIPLRKLAHPLMRYYGDTHFDFIQYGKGYLHSWSYTYFRLPNNELLLIGALNEKAAFTFFQYDHSTQRLSIRREAEGWDHDTGTPFFDLFIASGTDGEVFEAWMAAMNLRPPAADPLIGWTSWYQYYTNISAELIEKHISGFSETDTTADIIQIDDGFQTAVGDWLSIKSTFPEGMQPLAQKIHANGQKAGLWLAPFVCDSRSKLFKNHPEWLLRHKSGKPVKAGYTPLWKGWFYALDFYHPGVQEYLASVLKKVVGAWGFDLLKLDFLYAVCILPRPHKTRGQILYEALSFIREHAGETLLLGCGVPLGPAFGLLDYCRIGADIHLRWEHRLLSWLRNRERVSTLLSLRSTLGRWQLNGLAFHNDPDVFILRSKKHHLTVTQQTTIWRVNAVMGHLLFCSDDIQEYTAEQRAAYQEAIALFPAKVQSVQHLKTDIYQIDFTLDRMHHIMLVNLTAKAASCIISEYGRVDVAAYGSLILAQ
jgi:alpha-galactosidase